MLRSIVSCAAIGLLCACAGVPRQTRVMSLANVEMSTDELRQRVYELGHREEVLIEEAVARIFGGSNDVATRKAAINWGLAAMPAVQEATLRPEPLVAVVDLWALAIQTDAWAREGPGRHRLGESRRQVERAAEQMVRECEALVGLALGRKRAGQLDEVRAKVARWAADNPITSPTFARPSASVAWARALAVDERSGPGSFVVSTEERLAALSQRVAMLNNNVMTRMRWTIELLVQDSLGTENAAALVDEAADDLAAERRAFTADLTRQSEEALARLASEREALTDQGNALLARADARARAVVDRLLAGLAILGVALILLVACAIWILRRAPRKPPGKTVGTRVLGERAAT